MATDDTIHIDIEANAYDVVKALQEINNMADTAAGKAKLLEKNLMDLSRTTGQSFQKTLSDIKQLEGQLVTKQVGETELSTTFAGFKTGLLKQDVTGQVYDEAAALAQVDQKLGAYATADSQAASANLNFDGSIKKVNASIGDEKMRLQQVAVELEKMKAAGRISTTGGPQSAINNIKDVIKTVSQSTGAQYAQVAKQLEQMGVPAKVAQTAVKGLNEEMLRGAKSSAGFKHHIDLVRTALGTLVAVGIFNFLQAISKGFSEVIRTMRELETATYNLTSAERVLSEQGVNISPKDLDETIKKLQQLDPLLSKIEATELVSRISRNVAPSLGFNKEQIDQLSQSVAIFALRNKGLGYSFEEVEKTMTEAFTTGKVSQGINKLGIKLDDQIVKDEALRMGLVQTADAFDKLTGKQEANVKAAAMLSLIYANAQKEVSHLPDYLKTADAAFGMFQARMTDVFTKIGEKLGPVLAQVFSGLATVLGQFLDYLDKNQKAFEYLMTAALGLGKILVGLISLIFKLSEAVGSLGAKAYEFLSRFPAIKKAMDDLFGGQSTDTPTSPFEGMADKAKQDATNLQSAIKDSEEKIVDIMAEARDKRAQIDENYRRKIEDANRDHAQKMEDIARDVERKQDDALRNYNQKIEDINRDANEKVAEANQDARQKEIDREKEYQEKLRELREKFLFDLEDALRERDARQVLRLIREYNMDKKNLEEKHKLDARDAKKDLQRKLADIERERQLKLAAAQRELAEKQAEIQRWAERERQDAQIALARKLADANLWHQRELKEYQQYLQRKLEDLAKAIVKEYQLTAAGAAAIYSLLNSYYGANGSISSLLANGLTASLNNVLSSSSSGVSSGGSLADPSWAANGYYGAAEGGSFIATRPTTITFGEAGPEMATFQPLGRTGADVGKVFGGATGGGQNSLSLKISLQDGLVADIVETSLDNVAAVIERVGREK